MDIISMIGIGAAALSTISLLPQLIRVWKTKSVNDISIGMCAIMCTSVVLWLIYGILALDVPLMAANSVVFVQSTAILSFKTKYGCKLGASNLKSREGSIREQGGETSTEIDFFL